MTIDCLQDIWWAVVVVFIGTMSSVFAIGWKARTQAHRLETLETCTKHQREDISELLQSQFAILDGLKQLHCNGEVTKAYARLQEHLSKKE